MATEKRLVEQLREMADRTPPICQYDKPEKTMIFGKEITVYCKPFEQFQELLRRAADALSVKSVEVIHCKNCIHWQPGDSFGGDSLDDMQRIGRCPIVRFGRREKDFCCEGERKDND